ncbi:hypothetical protein HPP92_007031 [Vanilla planifolia]|uniref:Uncharacterized protein n=1 Tax=Vanilla planifolia TaxID=51239 RepID=A0A835RDK8_VANPL|nr:hypothetical protein HPP92_007284 [Vanilla planifolia]KAG0490168.1 hypothetical protein HPP92_007031 [Vanilla planifolia]
MVVQEQLHDGAARFLRLSSPFSLSLLCLSLSPPFFIWLRNPFGPKLVQEFWIRCISRLQKLESSKEGRVGKALGSGTDKN